MQSIQRPPPFVGCRTGHIDWRHAPPRDLRYHVIRLLSRPIPSLAETTPELTPKLFGGHDRRRIAWWRAPPPGGRRRAFKGKPNGNRPGGAPGGGLVSRLRWGNFPGSGGCITEVKNTSNGNGPKQRLATAPPLRNSCGGRVAHVQLRQLLAVHLFRFDQSNSIVLRSLALGGIWSELGWGGGARVQSTE